MNETRILYKTSRVIILQVAFILFAAIGVSLFIFVSHKDPIVIFISIFSILLSFMGPIALLKRVNGIPALIINNEGIYSENHKVIIRWNEIESFTFESYKWTENLVLRVSNPEKIIARSSGIKRLVNSINKFIYPNHFAIEMGQLQIKKSDLENELIKRLNEQSQRSQ